MLIEKCQINRYGKLSDFTSSFSPGLNIIKGMNEAGKSTLVEAIIDALFENPKTKKKDVKAKTSWGFEKDFEISIDFKSEGMSYTLSKDFDNGSLQLLKKSSGEMLDDKKRVDNIVSESLGLSNKDIFLATSCIRQDEIARITSSPEAIKDRLEGLITGGKEEVLASKAIDNIGAQIKDLDYDKGYKNKGQLQRIEEIRKDLEYELDKAKRETDAVTQNRAKLKEARTKLEKIEEELKVKAIQKKNTKLAIEVNERVIELEGRFGDLLSRTTNIKNSEKNMGLLRDNIAKLPQIDRKDVTIAEEHAVQARFLEMKKEKIDKEIADLAEQVNLAKPGFGVKVLSILSFLGAGGAGFYWYQFTAMTEINFLIGAGVSLLLFFLFSIIWSIKSKHCSEFKSKHNLKKARLEEIEEDLDSNKDAMQAILEKYKSNSADLLKEKYEKHSEIEKEMKNELSRYEGYLGDKTLKELEDEMKDVTKELALEREKLQELKVYVTSSKELAALEISVEVLETSKKQLESERANLEKLLDFAESGIEHQASLEERLEENQYQLERKKRRLQILIKTKEFIEKARKDVLKSSLQQLDDETSGILSEVTDGKYSQVKFDRQSLKFEVFSTELGDWVEPENHLSRGTIDQLYLATRLALVKIISEDKHPIVILDDPFVTFDKKRRDNALTIIKRLAERYQILLLTCHDYYDNFTENVTSLA